MEVKLLSECGTEFVLAEKTEKNDKYVIDIEPGDYLVIEVGAKVNKPVAKFRHPNIAATAKRVFEFKHYRRGGSKFWTSAAGVSHYFVIPRSAVKMLPEKGLSYINAEINGAKVVFNVSGGGGGGVWTDWLRTYTQISVNHPLRDVEKIAEVAVRGTPLEPIKTEQLSPEREACWNQLAAKASGNVKESIVGLVEAGKKPIIKFLSGIGFGGQNQGEGVEVERGFKKHRVDEQNAVWQQDGMVKRIVLLIEGHRVRAKLSQIDWYATAQANRLEGAA